MAKGANAIFEVAKEESVGKWLQEVLRLPLGKDGSARWSVKLQSLRENLDATDGIWSSTDHDD